jgi:hypothetical protein
MPSHGSERNEGLANDQYEVVRSHCALLIAHLSGIEVEIRIEIGAPGKCAAAELCYRKGMHASLASQSELVVRG